MSAHLGEAGVVGRIVVLIVLTVFDAAPAGVVHSQSADGGVDASVATFPTSDEIGTTLTTEVGAIYSAYSACTGMDMSVAPYKPSLTPFEQFTVNAFDKAVVRMELVYVERGLPGHLLSYVLWLQTQVPPQQIRIGFPTIRGTSLRGSINAFAALASDSKQGMVSAQPRPITISDDTAQALVAAACKFQTGPSYHTVLSDVNGKVDHIVGGASTGIEEQDYFLAALAADPVEVIQAYMAALDGHGNSEYENYDILDLSRKAQQWLDNPVMQRQHRSVFNYLVGPNLPS